MKRILAPAVFLFLLAVQPAHASDSAASYVDLKDGPTISVDWSKGSTQFVTLHGNRMFEFLNGEKGKHYTVAIAQDATGSRTVTFPSSVRWPGVTPPISPPLLTATANKTDYVTFIYNGVTYDALGVARNY
jgi:hypothetical protein